MEGSNVFLFCKRTRKEKIAKKTQQRRNSKDTCKNGDKETKKAKEKWKTVFLFCKGKREPQ